MRIHQDRRIFAVCLASLCRTYDKEAMMFNQPGKIAPAPDLLTRGAHVPGFNTAAMQPHRERPDKPVPTVEKPGVKQTTTDPERRWDVYSLAVQAFRRSVLREQDDRAPEQHSSNEPRPTVERADARRTANDPQQRQQAYSPAVQAFRRSVLREQDDRER